VATINSPTLTVDFLTHDTGPILVPEAGDERIDGRASGRLISSSTAGRQIIGRLADRTGHARHGVGRSVERVVFRTLLRVITDGSSTSQARLTVTFRLSQLGLLVPSEIRESYATLQGNDIDGLRHLQLSTIQGNERRIVK
jgi:hypothetical protein